jgi:hypothetical protein
MQEPSPGDTLQAASLVSSPLALDDARFMLELNKRTGIQMMRNGDDMCSNAHPGF